MTITAFAPRFTKCLVRSAPPSWSQRGLSPVGDHRVELAQERASQQRASLLGSSSSVSNGPGQANE